VDWKSWQYKNISILISSFLFSLVLGLFQPYHEILYLAPYIAALLAGVIFVFTFATPIAAVTLLILAQKFPLINLLIFAGAGAIISDFTLFRNFKDGIAEEVEPIFKTIEKSHFRTLLSTKHFRRLDPVLGGILLLTPLPREIGLNLIGIHKLKSHEFIAISALVNVVGILFILLLSLFIKL
jgi:hypothetical protein